jgi:hypothetical protein
MISSDCFFSLQALSIMTPRAKTKGIIRFIRFVFDEAKVQKKNDTAIKNAYYLKIAGALLSFQKSFYSKNDSHHFCLRGLARPLQNTMLT